MHVPIGLQSITEHFQENLKYEKQKYVSKNVRFFYLISNYERLFELIIVEVLLYV